jgi:hypothetical protein
MDRGLAVMKFGQTWEEERKKYAAPQGKDWRDWFAWYRVRVHYGPNECKLGRWVWLEWIQYSYPDGMTYNVPCYREKPPEELKNDT